MNLVLLAPTTLLHVESIRSCFGGDRKQVLCRHVYQCESVCARACVHACVHACVRTALLAQPGSSFEAAFFSNAP